jgi:uncharacterized membrane protein YdjX (TVP38/TMEM64 family)
VSPRLIFIVLQALQVIIAPIPGEASRILCGYLFGEWLGPLYSTLGLTVGSVAAFGWAAGLALATCAPILCFIIYLIPGLPKDMACYLFGISPMPLWVFTLVSTLGRSPGTWISSPQGAHAAAGDYLQVILLTDRRGAGLTALLLSDPHRLLAPRPLPKVGDPAGSARYDDVQRQVGVPPADGAGRAPPKRGIRGARGLSVDETVALRAAFRH